MKRIFQLGVALLFVAGLNSCDKDDDPVVPVTPTTTIDVLSMSYSPANKSVVKGTIVTWRNTDVTAHTATSNDGVTFDTGNISAGGTKNYTADSVGVFPYHCIIHGLSMAGTLTVTP